MNSRCLGVRTLRATLSRRMRGAVGTGHTPITHQPRTACAAADAIRRAIRLTHGRIRRCMSRLVDARVAFVSLPSRPSVVAVTVTSPSTHPGRFPLDMDLCQ